MLTTLIVAGSIWEIVKQTSAFGLFILLALVFMSFVAWVIIANKWRHFRAVTAANDAFLKQFRRATRLSEAAGTAKSQRESHLAQVFSAGLEELNSLREGKNQGAGLQESVRGLDESDIELIEMAMEKSLTEEMGRLERRTIFLATTGNSAPFMGLLGTVVGIMDSFWSIGQSGSASLAVVAPGIAEALLATIVGLGAAIPAVMAYNWANNRQKRFYDDGSAFLLEFISRAKKEDR